MYTKSKISKLYSNVSLFPNQPLLQYIYTKYTKWNIHYQNVEPTTLSRAVHFLFRDILHLDALLFSLSLSFFSFLFFGNCRICIHESNHSAHSYKSFKAESTETWGSPVSSRSFLYLRKVINHEQPYCFVALLCLGSGEIFEYFIDRPGGG